MGIFDIFTTDAQDKARDSQVAGINAGLTGAGNLLETGRGALTTNYGKALDAFAPATAMVNGTGTNGYNAFGDATGANGQVGLDRAGALFKGTPGYTEGINMTLDQNDRRNAARGMLSSGGTIADTTKLATDYANQKYGDYTSRLAPFMAVPGQAAGVASGIAGIDTGLGTGLNSSFGTQADLFNKGQVGIGNANANADLASLTASGNIINAGMGVAKMLMGAGFGVPSMPSMGGGGPMNISSGSIGGTGGSLGGLY